MKNSRATTKRKRQSAKKKRSKVRLLKIQEVEANKHIVELEVVHGPDPSTWEKFAHWLESIWQ